MHVRDLRVRVRSPDATRATWQREDRAVDARVRRPTTCRRPACTARSPTTVSHVWKCACGRPGRTYDAALVPIVRRRTPREMMDVLRRRTARREIPRAPSRAAPVGQLAVGALARDAAARCATRAPSPDRRSPARRSTRAPGRRARPSSRRKSPYSPYSSPAGTSGFGSQPPRSYTATFGIPLREVVRPAAPPLPARHRRRARVPREVRREPNRAARAAAADGSAATVLSGAPG